MCHRDRDYRDPDRARDPDREHVRDRIRLETSGSESTCFSGRELEPQKDKEIVPRSEVAPGRGK